MLDTSPTARAIRYFETLTPAALAGIDAVYAPQARFKDPFNEVQGTTAIRRVYAHMFETLAEPRFVVLDSTLAHGRCCLVWQMHFRQARGGRPRVVHGSSYLRYDAEGRIELHRDYWDAAEEIYEHVPLLGRLLRAVKRRLAAG